MYFNHKCTFLLKSMLKCEWPLLFSGDDNDDECVDDNSVDGDDNHDDDVEN